MRLISKIAGGVLVMTAGFCAVAQAAEPITIKFVHDAIATSPEGQGATLFAKLVDEQLKGKVKVVVYPNSSLFNVPDGIAALQAGNIQMIAADPAKLKGFDKSMQIYSLPFLFGSIKQVEGFSKSAEGRKLYKPLEKSNLSVLSLWPNGFKQLTNSVRPISKPADYKGISFRVVSSGLAADVFKSQGASATVIPYNQLYTALQQGTVQGFSDPFTDIDNQRFYEVQKYLTISNQGFLGYLVLTNPGFWNKLPADIRTKLEQIMDKVQEHENELSVKLNAEALDHVKKVSKMQITTLNDEQVAAFKTAFQPLYKKYSPIIGEEYIKAAQAMH
ncbi:MAG TPA: DctP family TRAP transporter solute-binding subunit [Castellaniella sp.]|uniref:DctP family TRAP transporter solute-binding subunit n=1 Tax=Castellaniella sp. TaxID=1955812 RepID=UPI002EDCF7ED